MAAFTLRPCLIVTLFLCAISAFSDDQLTSSLSEFVTSIDPEGRIYSDPIINSKIFHEPDLYELDVNFKVKCENRKCTSRCTSKIKNSNGILQVQNDDTECQDIDDIISETSEYKPNTEPIELVHEVQYNPTSGEQFIAIRKNSINNGDWCAGCPTDISVDAEGVQELADSAIVNLNRHKPNSKHTLKRIVRVQRQAQIVNGVRYILLLEVDATACESNAQNSNSEQENEVVQACLCQVTFLEKPWLRLANGDKYRAILSNNCTEEYIFGDEGEIVNTRSKEDPTDNNFNDIYKVVHKNELSAVNEQNKENRELTVEQVKDVESQIITDEDQTDEVNNSNPNEAYNVPEIVVKEQVDRQAALRETYNVKAEPAERENVQETIDQSEISQYENFQTTTMISEDKKQAFDGLLDFFGFDKPVSRNVNDSPRQDTVSMPQVRTKRSILSVRESETEEQTINRLAKLALETLDEFDSDDSKRVILEILNFKKSKKGPLTNYYIKIKTGVSKCLESNENVMSCSSALLNDKTMICNIHVEVKPNGDSKVLKSNCVKDNGALKRNKRAKGLAGGANPVDLDDPRILALAQESLRSFDLQSSSDNKHKVINILSATRQVVAGTLTKIKFEIKETTCLKNDVADAEKCKLLDNAISKTCIASIWDRPWLPDGKEITINCEPTAKSRSERDTESDIMNRMTQIVKDHKSFVKFLKNYPRLYINDRAEYHKRFDIFRENLKLIDQLNEGERGTAKYGPNEFADMSPEEFRRTRLGLKPDLRLQNSVPMMKAITPDVEDLPDSFDWRDKGAVTAVKNQGSCGSCWAFSVTGNIEGQYEIKNGKLLSLSEQELVDCDKLDEGCNGGLPDNAYRAIEQLGGLELENDYPYDAKDEKCQFNQTLSRVQISGAVNISSNETEMQMWLFKNGPISIGINANAMQFYMGGISHPFKFLCSPNNLDHGVLIVGYGIHTYPLFNKTMPFWIIKNSWGESWGERGYYRVYRGDGTCGVNMMASSAII